MSIVALKVMKTGIDANFDSILGLSNNLNFESVFLDGEIVNDQIRESAGASQLAVLVRGTTKKFLWISY